MSVRSDKSIRFLSFRFAKCRELLAKKKASTVAISGQTDMLVSSTSQIGAVMANKEPTAQQKHDDAGSGRGARGGRALK